MSFLLTLSVECTEHIGRYLLSNGDDLPGNFTLGEQAMLRVRRKPVPVPDVDYPALAESVIEGRFQVHPPLVNSRNLPHSVRSVRPMSL